MDHGDENARHEAAKAAEDLGHPKVVAAFDFDGTISTTDSLRDFVKHTVGVPAMVYGALCALPWLLGMWLGWCDRGVAKAKFLSCALKGRTQEQLTAAGQRYAHGPLQALLRPEMLQRVHEHLQRGHVVLLVSASPALYLRVWAQQMGLNAVLATELAFAQGQFSGRLATPNCWGPEKVHRLQQYWGQQRPAMLYAYGDSRGDTEMLALADIAWLRGSGALPELP